LPKILPSRTQSNQSKTRTKRRKKNTKSNISNNNHLKIYYLKEPIPYMKSQSNKNQSHDSQMQTNLEHIRSKPSPIRGKKQKTTDVKFSKTHKKTNKQINK